MLFNLLSRHRPGALRGVDIELQVHAAAPDALSQVQRIAAGVPQGSCLSPVCYARYTDDIPVEGGTKLVLEADDAAFFSVSRNTRHAVFFNRLLQVTGLLHGCLTAAIIDSNRDRRLNVPIRSTEPSYLQTIRWFSLQCPNQTGNKFTKR